jgi:hypothetical protein
MFECYIVITRRNQIKAKMQNRNIRQATVVVPLSAVQSSLYSSPGFLPQLK